MQRLRARLGAAITVACGVLAVGSGARADERTDARREFRAGMQDVAAGKYDDGVAHLERAYDILPHPNVLYNIGLAHMYAGRTEQALEYFERYKEMAPVSDALEIDSLMRSLKSAKPAEPAAVKASSPSSSPATPVGELDSAERITELERSARELRRLADEQSSDVLRQRADELDQAIARMRAKRGPTSSAVPSPEGQTTGTSKPDAVNEIAQQTPPVTLPSKGEARQDVYEEQVVSASRFAQSPLDAPNATAIITAQDIRMSGLTQLSHLLRRIAGVEVNQVAPNHAEVSIRGLNRRSSNKVLILWDGRPVRKDFMGTAYWDVLPVALDDVERIEIIRGPASALYGADAFSGVINVITRAPGEGTNYAVARGGNHRTGQAGMSLTGRAGDVSYRLSGQHHRTDNAVDIVGEDRVDIRPYTATPEMAMQTTSANGQLDVALGEGALASAGGYFVYGDNTIQGLSRVGQVTYNDSSEGQVFGSITTPVGIRLSALYNHVHADTGQSWFAPNSVSGPSFLTMRQSDVDLSWSRSLKLLIPQTITVGGAYRYKHITWNWLDADHTQHHFAGYLQDVLQLAAPLRLQVGARIDHHPLLPDLQFSPRGSLVYRFLEAQSIRVAGGRAFRAPSLLESYLLVENDTPLRGVTGWGKGNSKLDPESITSIEVGYQNQASDYFSLEANFYYNWIKDAILITQNDQFTLSDYAGRNPLADYNPNVSAYPVSALSYANERATYRQIGGELGIRVFPVEGLDIYTNYSIHDTGATDKDKVEAERANEQQTSLHKVNAGIQYRSWFGLEGSLDLSWFSDQVWIEQVTDVQRGGVRWQQYAQPSFVMLSGRLGYRLFKDRLELGVSATNLVSQGKRQHPLGQPLDTRVLGTAKVRF
jgi:outer membrane receptor for ferrienterochelin and colicin